MKNKLYKAMATALLVGACLMPSTMAQAAETDGNTLLYSFPVNTEDSAGFIPANEHEKIVPDAFFVSGDRIFLDDTANNRIIIYRGQNFEKSIPLSPEMDVKLLFYSSEDDVLKMVYWDRFNENGSHFYLTSVSVSSGETVPAGQELSDGSRILLEYSFDSTGNLLTEYLSGEGTGAVLAYADAEPAVIADGNAAGSECVGMGFAIDDTYSIYSIYMAGADRSTIGECIIINGGSDAFAYAVPETHEDSLERGNVQVTESGEVFQMAVDATGVKIFRLGKQAGASMEDVSLLEREVDGISDMVAAPYASYKTMDTATIRARMDTYKDLKWVYNSTRNSNASVTADPGKVSQPGWITQNADGKDHILSNVPYCWGGWNAETYVKNINNGKYAGNVTTTAPGYVSGTVGMDCSGYVSVAFDLPYKHGTSTLSNCFTKISNTGNVRAYDILNKSGSHVLIVVKTYVQDGVRYVDTYEEAKSSGKIVFQTGRNYQSLLNSGYIPMRYNYLR